MANFDIAVEKVLEHEGGYSLDPDDAGGETNFGISKRSYPGVDIKSLTVEDAKVIYKRDFWAFDGVRDQNLATKVLDMSVNLGQATAMRLIQRALNVTPDGVYGTETERALNSSIANHLIVELRARAACRHALLCLATPSQSRFLFGWLRRDCS